MSQIVSPEIGAQEEPRPPIRPRDPWLWCLAIPAVFAAIAAIRLAIPSAPVFDEVHYLPAAREWLTLLGEQVGVYRNPEHPPLGKQLIAAGIHLFGDNPIGWRVMSLVAGTIALAASMRALWQASHDRFATITFGVLLATGFHLFIHARIAMLDIFMAAFLAVATWLFVGAIRKPETGRWRLALCGIAVGAALASKWSAVPLAMTFGLAFFAARLSAGRRRLFTSTRGWPVPGISLLEAVLWLGLVPLSVYSATYAPAYWLGSSFQPTPFAEKGLIGQHMEMLELQGSVIAPHNYQSTWQQWMLNTRGVWYFYEEADGAQRGVMLIGNPLTMLLGLPALLWCLAMGLWRKNWAQLGVVIGYALTLGLWLIAPKPVQFYYHYFLPSFFLLAALAITLSDLAKREAVESRPYISYSVIVASVAVFAVFFPILSAGALEGPDSFAYWVWIEGWR